MNPMHRLHIRSNRENLWLALSTALASHFGDAMASTPNESPVPGDVVVMTRDVASVPLCREQACKGVRVLVLAPLPRAEQQAAFLAAGAFGYFAMDLDLSGLVAAVATALI